MNFSFENIHYTCIKSEHLVLLEKWRLQFSISFCLSGIVYFHVRPDFPRLWWHHRGWLYLDTRFVCLSGIKVWDLCDLAWMVAYGVDGVDYMFFSSLCVFLLCLHGWRLWYGRMEMAYVCLHIPASVFLLSLLPSTDPCQLVGFAVGRWDWNDWKEKGAPLRYERNKALTEDASARCTYVLNGFLEMVSAVPLRMDALGSMHDGAVGTPVSPVVSRAH